jgi:hypothetical protein
MNVPHMIEYMSDLYNLQVSMNRFTNYVMVSRMCKYLAKYIMRTICFLATSFGLTKTQFVMSTYTHVAYTQDDPLCLEKRTINIQIWRATDRDLSASRLVGGWARL